MAEQDKSPTQAAAEPPQSPSQVYAVQQPGVAPYAPYGSYYPYAAPGDGTGHPADPTVGAPAGAYMMAFPPPPGMIYAYPQGYPALPFGPGMALPAALVRPKRKQVKTACTNCAAACKKCDDARPCERCCKYRLADSCIDGQRKERKKGVKRGPYKRKGKDLDDSPEQTYESLPPEQTQATTPAPPPSTGFYPSYFYPPPSFVPIGPDGQPMQADANGQPVMHPHPQYYPLHPAYAPFTAYPHPAAAGYPMMAPGHMPPMPQPGPSEGENVVGAPAGVEASPPKSNGSNKGSNDNGNSNGNDKDSQGDSPPRRKRQRLAANSGRDNNGPSKKLGKRAAAAAAAAAAAQAHAQAQAEAEAQVEAPAPAESQAQTQTQAQGNTDAEPPAAST